MSRYSPQVVQDEQVKCKEGPEGTLHGVVHPGLSQDAEVVVGMHEANCVSDADGGVAQSMGQEVLANAGGSPSRRRFKVIDADKSKSLTCHVSGSRHGSQGPMRIYGSVRRLGFP